MRKKQIHYMHKKGVLIFGTDDQIMVLIHTLTCI